MKARGRASKAAPSKEAASPQSQASKDLADFSNEYAGLKLSINVEGLGEVEGRLLKASRYWFKLLTSNGVLYVNKAYIISIKPLEISPLVQRAAALWTFYGRGRTTRATLDHVGFARRLGGHELS